jgi:tetratricopeptide (TPR) repeat protein
MMRISIDRVRRGRSTGRRARAGAGWALAALLLATAGPAWAEEPKQEAKARYTTGQSHYNLNEFKEALQDFKEAYRLFPDPVFLFNVAQCERQLGNLEEAIQFYRSYLRNKPKAPNRQEVLRRIDEMQAAIDAKKLASEKPPLTLVPPTGGDEPRVPAPVPAAIPAAAPVAPARTPGAAPVAPVPPVPAPVPTVELASSGEVQAGGGDTRTDLVAETSSPAPAASPAIYQRWWFWTAAAVVVAGVGVGAYAVLSHGGNGAPGAKLGTQPVF